MGTVMPDAPAALMPAELHTHVRSEGFRRWCVLILYFVVSFMQGVSWAPFSMLPHVSGKLFPALKTESMQAMMLNFNNIMQAAAALPAACLLVSHAKFGYKTGLRATLLMSVLGLCAQSGLWALATLFPLDACVPWMLLSGAALGGLGCAFAQGCVSRLSAVWFPAEARGLATAVAYAAVYSGMAFANVVSLEVYTADQLRTLLCLEAIVAGTLFASVSAIFPDAPCHAFQERSSRVHDLQSPFAYSNDSPEVAESCGPCASAQAGVGVDHVSRLTAGKLTSCLLLLIAGAGLNGFFIGWQSSLPIMWGTREADILSFMTNIAFPIGSIIAGPVADRYFARRLKRLLLFLIAMSCINFAAIVVLMPPPPWKPNRDSQKHVVNEHFTLFSIFIVLASMATGASGPVVMELLAEVGHPVREGTTANALTMVMQLACALNTSLVSCLSAQAMNVVMLVIALVCLVITSFVHERYDRLDIMVDYT